jgi:hypothetical protein
MTCSGLLALSLSVLLIEGVSAQDARPRRNPSEITQEELANPSVGQLNLLQVIQQLRPNWLRVRGSPSLTGGGRSTPGVVLDNMSQSFERLASLRAADVTSLVFLSAGDATTRFGTGYPNGAILVTTINGRP